MVNTPPFAGAHVPSENGRVVDTRAVPATRYRSVCAFVGAGAQPPSENGRIVETPAAATVPALPAAGAQPPSENGRIVFTPVDPDAIAGSAEAPTDSPATATTATVHRPIRPIAASFSAAALFAALTPQA